MRYAKIKMGRREYEVSESGEIVRMPFGFIMPNGAMAVKKARPLKQYITPNGYGRVCIGRRLRMAHRIIYEAFNGPIPEGMDIDHINGNRADNRLENLRVATRKNNSLNRQGANKNSRLGVRGVYYHKSSGCYVFAVSGKPVCTSRNLGKVVEVAEKYHGG